MGYLDQKPPTPPDDPTRRPTDADEPRNVAQDMERKALSPEGEARLAAWLDRKADEYRTGSPSASQERVDTWQAFNAERYRAFLEREEAGKRRFQAEEAKRMAMADRARVPDAVSGVGAVQPLQAPPPDPTVEAEMRRQASLNALQAMAGNGTTQDVPGSMGYLLPADRRNSGW